MSDVTMKRLGELETYKLPVQVKGLRFRDAGKDLGVTAFGINVIELDPGCLGYPEHDHESQGREEVYVVLRGTAVLETGAEKRQLEQGALVRVGANQMRKFVPGPAGATLLALNGTPGKAWEPMH